DDTADLTFDVTDCGVGTATAAAIRMANGTVVNAVETGNSPSSCANGNRTHHFKATVSFAAAAPVLPDPDASGTGLLPVSSDGGDRLQNRTLGTAPAGAMGGDGIVSISIWRWKRKMVGVATGAPAVIPGGGTPRVAVGTASAVTAFSRMGAQSWSQSVGAGVGADLAIGPSGNVYAVSPAAPCSPLCTGTLTIVGATGTPL